ncbi:hypothetical protein D7Z54_01675 [Salibacterium salarium]|uniref:Uncharacterized protein n=1 Tax=Salibacterium salarium TaxID=284579 RepID=A0A3R9PAZ3_9BACI|nr:hypothetical protein [Salibacterium salarium]RSL35300.1 hypothetical protein D7Z54_01675 [Salibacterium salarium]
MTDTMNKLKESKFFLNKMNKYYEVDPDFNFYLSAFISAARSVTWIMKSEFIHVEGWENWFNKQEPGDKELLRKTNDIRIQTIKKSSLHTGRRAVLDIPKERITEEAKKYMRNIDKQKVKFTIRVNEGIDKTSRVDENGVTFTGEFTDIFRKIDEFPDEDILGVCQRYIDELEKLVLECEKFFADKLEEKYVEGSSIKFADTDLFE